ncbi:MAG TPA: hypothetical protein VGQ95_09075 [Chthoniobacterales bacterium]|nr:hypothetical protein [Chthoniobacterales bacterium]
MLSEPVSFTGTLSLKDALDLNHYHFRYVVDWPVRILMAATSFCIAALLIVAVGPSHFTPFIILVLGLCAYFPFGWILHRRLGVWWYYRRHPDQYIEHTVTVTNDSVSTSSARADMRLNWDGIKAVISTSRGLLFIVPRHSAWFWLPQREFDGNTKKEQILKVAGEHNVRIERMA